jgi:SAM-dependent methyltransferase
MAAWGDRMKRHSADDFDRQWDLAEFRCDEGRGVYEAPSGADSRIAYSDGDKAEDYILRSIQQAKDVSYGSDELMLAAKDWPSHYHLGLGRANILEALELPPRARVLELGAGCGSITRYLAETFESVDAIEGSLQRAEIARQRCRNLTNVRLFASNFRHIRFDPAYEIATLVGVLEYAPLFFLDQGAARHACLNLLKLTHSALKNDGLLIVAIENRIGIKYWSGFPEDHSGKLFDGIHGYPRTPSAITFSRKELAALLEEAGFGRLYFYHCFPDYKFASTIISDRNGGDDHRLHNWIDTPFPHHSSRPKYTFHDGLVTKTLSEAGLLREFANSFLVVASKQDSPLIADPTWIAKKYSLSRKKKLRCVTTLRAEPGVKIEKKRLSGEAQEIAIEYGSMKVKHNVGDAEWHDGDLMIFDAFSAFFEKDFCAGISSVLQTYYGVLIEEYDAKRRDEEGYPLLRGEAVDFILRNVVKRDGKFMAIDNEWAVEGTVAADFVLYRCILFDIIKSQAPWIEGMINRRYGLTGLIRGSRDRFIIEMIRGLLPMYGGRRHKENKRLQKQFGDSIGVDRHDISNE